MKQDKEDLKVDVSWTNYSNKDKEKIKITSDMSFLDIVILYPSVRNRILAIAIIAFLVLII